MRTNASLPTRLDIARRAAGLSLLVTAVGFGQEPPKQAGTNVAAVRQEANAAHRNKDYQACARLFEQAARSVSSGAAMNDYYNAGCCYALDGDLDKALEMLRRAVDAGYTNVNHMKGDADLENLRGDPRWEKLLATIVVPPIRITKNLTTDPAKAPFVYDDVEHFLHAMTLVADDEDSTGVLEREYFGKATPGLKQFVIKYGLTAEAVAAAINKRPEKYEKIAERLAQIRSREAAFKEALAAFKTVVPDAVFPPTYFLVSDYGGIASGSPDGQLITIERRTRESINRMETLLVHELLHFQQLVATGPDEFYALFGEKKSLLGLTIREGAAEFVAGRVTGTITQQDALNYLLEHEREVWERFKPQMFGRDTSGWMWSKPSDPGQPRDLAYALGLRVVEAYYNKAPDKARAMREILSVTDYPRFLEKSGYGRFADSP
jgi:tetratricopeptide (TPR) repeat protein